MVSSSISLYSYLQSSNNEVCSCLISLEMRIWHIIKKFIFDNIKIQFSSFSCPHYGKSPSPYGEGLDLQPNHLYTAYRSAVNLQPDHLYTTYRSVVNFLYIYILTSIKRKVNRTFYENFMLKLDYLCISRKSSFYQTSHTKRINIISRQITTFSTLFQKCTIKSIMALKLMHLQDNLDNKNVSNNLGDYLPPEIL